MGGSLKIQNELNKRINSIDKNVIDTSANCTKSQNISIFDLALLILSVFSIFIDIFTDLVLVIQYSNQGYKSWAFGTFMLIFFPSLVVQFFSLRWHIIDNTSSVLHWVLHFCMLGIVHRYIQVIVASLAAFKSKNLYDVQKVFLNQNDLCMLHLFESFLESAPQLVLQVYVIATLQECRFWTGLSALASLLSLAWALAAYTKAQRRARANKNITSWLGLLFQAVWRTGMLTSRISALVLAAYCFRNYIFLLITIHWLAMTIWIIYQKTDFCETYWEEKIYNAVVGVIYCFCFFNLQEGRSRWRAIAFYLVIVFQNFTCLTIFLLWFGEKNLKLSVSAFVTIIGGIFFGSAGMLLYYRFFHPSGPINFFFYPQSTKADDTTFYSSLTLRSLKRIRCESQIECHRISAPQCDKKASFSDSVIIVEENDSDVEIKILQEWINGSNDKGQVESDAHKRRGICSDDSKLMGDEESSEILSTHDYENLCAVNIARESWGLRSWRGYSNIEIRLHDDSVFHDRRLDTLTSTTSSDSTVQKETERAKQDDYTDPIAEDFAQCESETNSDCMLGEYTDSYLTEHSSGRAFEKMAESGTERPDLKSSASTLVATIEEICMSTPVRNRSNPLSHINYHGFSPLSDVKLNFRRNRKKISCAPKLLAVPEDRGKSIKQNENFDVENIKLQTTDTERKQKKSISTEWSGTGENEEICNKENISTVATRISHWNKIINTQNEKNRAEKEEAFPPKQPNISKNILVEKESTFQKAKS